MGTGAGHGSQQEQRSVLNSPFLDDRASWGAASKAPDRAPPPPPPTELPRAQPAAFSALRSSYVPDCRETAGCPAPFLPSHWLASRGGRQLRKSPSSFAEPRSPGLACGRREAPPIRPISSAGGGGLFGWQPEAFSCGQPGRPEEAGQRAEAAGAVLCKAKLI